MIDLYDRNFITDRTKMDDDLNVGYMDPHDGKLMRGMTQERVETIRNVEDERKRATKREDELEALIRKYHTYELQKTPFGGSWDKTKWPDSVTIFDGEDEITTIAIPPMGSGYDKDDVLNLPFFNNGLPYYLHVTMDNEDGRPIIDGIWKPSFDTKIYTIGISTRTLPWLEMIPTTETYNAVLCSGHDPYTYEWKAPAPGMYSLQTNANKLNGGSTGQILRKKSNTNYDFEWVNP